MAAYFLTNLPQALLNKFDAAIGQTEQAGKVKTWKKVNGFYTHVASDWTGKAYFKPAVANGHLAFNIFKPNGGPALTRLVFAYYQGHLIETFINHFFSDFSSAQATPSAAAGDSA